MRISSEQERLMVQGMPLREAFLEAAVRVRETLMRQESGDGPVRFGREKWQALSEAIIRLQAERSLHPLERHLLE